MNLRVQLLKSIKSSDNVNNQPCIFYILQHIIDGGLFHAFGFYKLPPPPTSCCDNNCWRYSFNLLIISFSLLSTFPSSSLIYFFVICCFPVGVFLNILKNSISLICLSSFIAVRNASHSLLLPWLPYFCLFVSAFGICYGSLLISLMYC